MMKSAHCQGDRSTEICMGWMKIQSYYCQKVVSQLKYPESCPLTIDEDVKWIDNQIRDMSWGGDGAKWKSKGNNKLGNCGYLGYFGEISTSDEWRRLSEAVEQTKFILMNYTIWGDIIIVRWAKHENEIMLHF